MLQRIIAVHLLMCPVANAADWTLDENPALAKYFESEVARIEEESSLFKYKTLEQWQAAQPELRQQLYDNLGLNPLPERTPLHAEVTGVVEEGLFRVEKIHFQSSPGLYVTGNLYLPKVIEKPLPTILYVCGHAGVKKDGVSMGNKTAYHHHGSWFARNGYACLTIDTLQLGEIEGIHHGTYRYDRWWWNSRGYTPAGVEAWNCMRALDYLETRPEVDAERFGVTGRSGGGAYSWWISTLDERIKCAVPVAGITTLRNHVIDGCVEGHCDCMYMLNASRWDYATVAALVAPRPLLLSNSDKDRIFPLNGVVNIHDQVRHIYDLYKKPRSHGLHITEGPHKDTQELRVHAFRWFNRWLKKDEALIETPAAKFFEPEQLRVFSELPANERNTTIDETFVPEKRLSESQLGISRRVDEVLKSPRDWMETHLATLRQKCVGAWPDANAGWHANNDVRMEVLEHGRTGEFEIVRIHFESQKFVDLSVDVVTPHKTRNMTPEAILQQVQRLEVFSADEQNWNAYAATFLKSRDAASNSNSADFAEFVEQNASEKGHAVAVFAGRGIGPHAFHGDKRKLTQIERRFQLIGTTSDTMRVWDLRRAVQVLRLQTRQDTSIVLSSNASGRVIPLLASLFDAPVASVVQHALGGDEDRFVTVFNLQKVVDIRESLPALAALRCPVLLPADQSGKLPFVQELTQRDAWPGHEVQFATVPAPRDQ